MPISPRNQAKNELRLKLRFEESLVAVLRGFNKRLIKSFVKGIGLDGATLDLNEDTRFQDELTHLLNKHNTNVIGRFSKQISPQLPKPVAITQEEQDRIDVALSIFNLARAGEQSVQILKSTQKDLQSAVINTEQIIIAEAAQGNIRSQMEKATMAGATASRALNGRSGTIASTETQLMAEVSKATEAQVLAGLSAPTQFQSTEQTIVTKEWRNAGGDSVRSKRSFDHSTPNGQTVDINSVFIISGERLRWPGDMGLHASPGNTVNCRCSAVHNIEQIIASRR